MKIVFSKSDLLNGVNIVSKAVPSKTTMTILECILIDASSDIIKLTANDVGEKINTAEITSYYNEEGLKDATPDNIGSDSFIVAIKTGHEERIAFLGVVILVATTMTVYLIKKRVQTK